MLSAFENVCRSILHREGESAFQAQAVKNVPIHTKLVGQVVVAAFVTIVQRGVVKRIIDWISP